MKSAASLALALAIALTLFGCPSKDEKRATPSAPTKCEKVGQSCEFSPGKLGTCVQKDDCTENCLVCQSQH